MATDAKRQLMGLFIVAVLVGVTGAGGVAYLLPDGTKVLLVPIGVLAGAALLIGYLASWRSRRSGVVQGLERTREHDRVQSAQRAADAGEWEWDPATDEVVWSASLWKLLGTAPPAEPLTLTAWSERVHPDDRPRFLSCFRESIHRGRYEDEYRVIHHDGGVRWLHARGRAQRGRAGVPERLAGMAVDVTERRMGETERARLAAIVESSDDAIISKDLDGIIMSWNRGAQRVFGYTAGEVIGKSILILMPPDRVGEEPEILAKLRRGERIDHFETERITRDGQRINVSLTVSPIFDASGGVIGASKIARDISERIRNEQALRELTRTLEQRVAQRTRQLQALTLEVVQTEHRERRRLAKALHDHIQQLLAAAKMHASLVNDRDCDVRDRVIELLDESIAACRTLTVELSPPILNDADLHTGLNWLGRQMQERHRLRVHVRSEGDRLVLPQQMLLLLFESVRELLFNVVKHARVDEAWVELSESDGMIWVRVRDRGAGCDPASLIQPHDGFGLFSIRERLVTVGGRFEASGNPGAGCEVRIGLPVGAVPSGAEVQPTSSGEMTGDAGAIRVLLVDDHTTMRKGLAGLLGRQQGIEVVGEAATGREAIALARTLSPDVVLMDVTMPDINGIDATRTICAEHPGVRVIGLSMHADPDMSVLMQQAGAEVYLSKDGPVEQLLAAIRGESSRAGLH